MNNEQPPSSQQSKKIENKTIPVSVLKNTDSNETQLRPIETEMLDFLTNKDVISSEEILQVDKDRIEELLVRSASDPENFNLSDLQSKKEKIRRTLGLDPYSENDKIDAVQRNTEIKQLTEEMDNYLNKFKENHPEVVGLILCGSRMDSKKLPAPNSDVDAVIILQKGLKTESKTKEGRALVQKLVSYTNENPTDSGLEVQLDEFYSTDELFKVLDSPEDKSRLTWGWNSKSVKYIGGDIDNVGDLSVNIRILESLDSDQMQKLKSDKIIESKEKIANYLNEKK